MMLPTNRVYRWLLALIATVAVGCKGISTDPGDPGDVDLYDVDVDIDIDRNDGTSDTGTGGGGDGGGPGPPIPPPPPEKVPSCDESFRAQLFAPSDGKVARSNTDAYTEPTDDRLDALRSALRSAKRDRWEKARSALDAAGYDVCRTTDRTGEILVWTPAGDPKGWSRFALRLDAEARPLVLQAPHPFDEPSTPRQAAALFTDLAARAVVVGGAHRCANTAHSRCDGETDVCGESTARFRTSDMAHAPETFFQLFHRRASRAFPNATILSLHGYPGDDYRGASLSNGTTGAVDPDAPVATLGLALESAFRDRTVTYCNQVPERSREPRDCGTTNLQGRHLNGVRDACRTSPNSATGRFLRLQHDLVDADNPSGLSGPLRKFLESQ